MVQTLSIQATDGRVLAGHWYADGVPSAGVVIHGATAVPQRFYAALATALARQGYGVLTYDYRGIGESRDRPIASDPATMRDWIADARAAQHAVAERIGSRPLLAIGHSIGGQIAAGLDGVDAADALVLVGAASGYYGRYPIIDRARLWFAWRLAIPALTGTLGYLPGWSGLGEDLPAGVALQWARWCTTPDHFLTELPQLRASIGSYTGRVLSLSFTDDDFAPLPNVGWLNALLSSAEVEHRHLDPAALGLAEVGHFGLFRRTARDTLWRLVADFLHDAAHPDAPRHNDEALLREIMSDLDYRPYAH